VPAVRKWLSEQTGVAPPPPPEEMPAASNSFRIAPQKDGSYEVTFGSGVELRQLAEGRWRVEQVPPADAGPFEPRKFMSDAVSKSIPTCAPMVIRLSDHQCGRSSSS
jgi:hypothetical protein